MSLSIGSAAKSPSHIDAATSRDKSARQPSLGLNFSSQRAVTRPAQAVGMEELAS